MSKARAAEAREREMVRLVRQGVSTDRVGDMFGVTPRRVRQIVASWRDVPTTPPPGIVIDGQAEVLRVIERLELLVEDLAVLAATADHEGTRLGAIRERRETERQLMELKRSIGLLPVSLDGAGSAQDYLALGRGLLEALRRVNADEATVTAVLEVVEGSAVESAGAVAA